MNVSTTGVQGYEYQYKVTLLIYLIHHAENLQLFVETAGNEDALLVLDDSNVKTRIQVQIKHERGSLNTEKLVDWLCHFEERQENASLIQRLSDKKDDIVLFAARSRCSDETVFLRSNLDRLNPHINLKVSREQKKNFITALKQIDHGASKLMQARNSFNSQLAQTLNKNKKLEKLFSGIVIWEELSDEKVDSTIINILTRNHQIASSLAIVTYLELLEEIKYGRNSQKDIQPTLRAVIQKRKIGRPITVTNYLFRGDEDKFEKIVLKEKLLLLTGLTLCGKSEVAKVIAANLVDAGYDYHHTSDVKNLKHFFATNITDHKIAILEDPWGHLNLLPGYERIFREIEQLLQNLQQHHHVIITSSLHRLFELFQTESLQNCNVLNRTWKDLTERDPAKTSKYWQSISLRRTIDGSVIELVTKGLMQSSSDHLLQIGQLKFLANYEKTELLSKSFHELEHIARRSSREIADWIFGKDPYYSEVLGVLAMVSTSIESIDYLHLGYIFSTDTSRPSFIEKDTFSIFKEKQELKFPSYGTSPILDQRTLVALEFLEERQLIKVVGESIQFSHPNYYEAGRFSFISKSKTGQQRLLEYLFKSVSSTSPLNAYLAANKIQFIYNRIRTDLRHELIDISFCCLNSAFPAVEDVSLAFLSNNIKDIQGDKLEKLIELIQRGGTSTEKINWYNGSIPFFSYERGVSRLFFTPEKALVKRAENLLNSNTLPPIQDGWELLESLKDGRDVPTHYFQVLFNYRETFIKKRVVLQFFRRLNQSYINLVNDIFSDEHPSIIFTAIRGSFLYWKDFNEEIRPLLIKKMMEAMSKEQVAIRSANLFSTFSAFYGSEGIFTLQELEESDRREIWNVWGLIYPIMVKNLPSDGIFINTARFGATMDEAIKYLDSDKGIVVFKAWFERIHCQILNGLSPDDFEMGIMLNLMQFTGQDSELRKGLFQELINYPDTNFMLSSLKWALEYWEDLNQEERQEILELLNSSREDIRWVKAVMLTREIPPEAIVSKILGQSSVFQKEVPEILEIMPDSLVQDCLNVICGSPYSLSRIGVHASNKSLWTKVMRYILTTNYRVGFEVCLQKFLHDGVNSFSSMWENPKELWKLICKSANDRKVLVESLIFNIGSCSCSISSATMLWRILMHSYSVCKNENEFTKIVASRIEMLQQTGHKEDLLQIMGKEFINKKLINEIQPDFLLITILEGAKKQYLNDEVTSDILDSLSPILDKTHIRFFLTFLYFEQFKLKKVISDKVILILNSLPNKIDDIGKYQIEEWEKKFEYSLPNWNIGNLD
ncbi:nSTAND3 domain-containing NTPase [Algoriphagus resistens]|uniref:nSTAND3 domain-containing NTPase n=1 Tax=Algoriphagus resistens TaxID=1750590 RepID=UPI000716BF19|nr:hypothetical protein [Algoriphagus resistens]